MVRLRPPAAPRLTQAAAVRVPAEDTKTSEAIIFRGLQIGWCRHNKRGILPRIIAQCSATPRGGSGQSERSPA